MILAAWPPVMLGHERVLVVDKNFLCFDEACAMAFMVSMLGLVAPPDPSGLTGVMVAHMSLPRPGWDRMARRNMGSLQE